MLHTATELAAELKKFGFDRSQGQIERWRKRGSLSGGVQREPEGPGRPPWLYPDYALDAALWMSRYCRRVRNANIEQQWLWLLGLHTGENIAPPDEIVQCYLRSLWDGVKSRVRRFPTLDEALTMKRNEATLSDEALYEWDSNVTVVEGERIGTVLLLLMMGSILPDEVLSLDETTDELEAPHVKNNLWLIKKVFQEVFGLYQPTDILRASSALSDPTLAARHNLLDLYEATLIGELDWGFMRYFFRELMMPTLFVCPGGFPKLDELSRIFYAQFTPEMAMTWLALASMRWSEEEKFETLQVTRETWAELLHNVYHA